MTPIKVMVVDDSAFMRKLISDLLNSDPDIEVVATSRNGKDCLKKFEELSPDVITLDIVMPVLDGLETLSKIKERSSIPVIMLSKLTRVGAENSLTAIERGAFDFVEKPQGISPTMLDQIKDELIEKVKIAAGADPFVVGQADGSQSDNVTPIHTTYQFKSKPNLNVKQIILVGSSTGGPKALHQLLSKLPPLEHSAMCIVQHMPPAFTLSLANRLNSQTHHYVTEAREGDRLEPGHIYVAPGGYHVELQQGNREVYIHLQQEEPRGGHRPSVDVLFESAINIEGCKIITVILTGMGKDGMKGLEKLKAQRKAYTIAEHESSCVVYGMPRAIVEAELADEVRPLHEIHVAIDRIIKS